MSKMFNKIKTYYEKGFWTKKMVGDAVGKKKITEEEYREFVEFVDDYNRKLQQKIDKWHSSFIYGLYSMLKVLEK